MVSTFAGGLAVAGGLAHLFHRDPREHDALDLVVLGTATFKAARTIARDEVTCFLRDPFVEGEAHEGGEDPVESGDMRQAIGDCGGGRAGKARTPLRRRRQAAPSLDSARGSAVVEKETSSCAGRMWGV